jgi:hypothetical protein
MTFEYWYKWIGYTLVMNEEELKEAFKQEEE